MADRGMFHACAVTHIMWHDHGNATTERNRTQPNATASAMLRRLLSLFVGMVTGAEAPAPDRRCPAQTLFGPGIMISIVGGTQISVKLAFRKAEPHSHVYAEIQANFRLPTPAPRWREATLYVNLISYSTLAALINIVDN